MQAESVASVAVARPVRTPFSYRVPEALVGQLRVGQRVLVPFGRGQSLGFYLGPDASGVTVGDKLKPITRILEATPALPEDVLALIYFAAEHYRYPLGEALKSALPPTLTGAEEEREVAPDYEIFAVALPAADPATLKRAPAQAAVLGYLLAVGGRANVEEVAHAIPGAKESLKKLAARALVVLEKRVLEPTIREGLGQLRPKALTPEQLIATDAVRAALDAKTFEPFLLHGVTGSGKTEVYLRAVEHAQTLGRGSLVLVPEIALTPQLVGRFRSRFGARVAVLHSGLKDRERYLHWRALRSGEVNVAVGVRSAIFAPVPSLGLVVVDEEHDGSFKQEEKFRYHARDLALVRGRAANATVLLGSATPSLESLEQARRGKYRSLRMKSRVDDRPMPTVELVDLRGLRPKDRSTGEEPALLSAPLQDALTETLARGQQAILFLNRRGHATFLVCDSCGTPVHCTQCDVSLTHHLQAQKLMCHYCGEARPVPTTCAACGGGLLKLGAGTERVAAEVADRFPKARVARLDRDSATNAEKVTELLAAFARRELDVLIGTQMVAKGHDFPGVTLVAVVLADTSLQLPDFRAGERTFQLLTQVAGRAGRGADAGRVLVQTYNPDAEPIARVVNHDFDGFAAQELGWRKSLSYPPFTRLVSIRVEGEDPQKTAHVAQRLGRRIEQLLPAAVHGVRLLGPAPAPILRVRGKTRWQMLLKGPSHGMLAPLLRQLETDIAKLPSNVRVILDVDPGAML